MVAGFILGLFSRYGTLAASDETFAADSWVAHPAHEMTRSGDALVLREQHTDSWNACRGNGPKCQTPVLTDARATRYRL